MVLTATTSNHCLPTKRMGSKASGVPTPVAPYKQWDKAGMDFVFWSTARNMQAHQLLHRLNQWVRLL